MNEEAQKHVDESWKDTVGREKAAGEDPASGKKGPVEVTFGLFVAGLMIECLIALGDMENPATRKKEPNLQHARVLIDTIEMLRTKTKNNLNKDEEEAVNSMLYDLRMRYVSKFAPTE